MKIIRTAAYRRHVSISQVLRDLAATLKPMKAHKLTKTGVYSRVRKV